MLQPFTLEHLEPKGHSTEYSVNIARVSDYVLASSGEVIIIGTRLPRRRRNEIAEVELTMDDILEVAANLAQELGTLAVKQRILEAFVEDVAVNRLDYTHQSMKTCR